MQHFEYIIQDPVGIHARPAGLLVKEAKKYASRITITKGERSADALRLMAVMSLGAMHGDRLTITVEGEDEISAARDFQGFLETAL